MCLTTGSDTASQRRGSTYKILPMRFDWSQVCRRMRRRSGPPASHSIRSYCWLGHLAGDRRTRERAVSLLHIL